MSVTINVKMNQNVQQAVKRCQARSLTLSGLEIERAMKQTLSASGGPEHTPSLPGTPPNRQHGELRSSVQSALRGDGNGVLAGATAKYAHIQEHGGTTHPTVTARMRKWAWAMYYKFGAAAIRGARLRGRARGAGIRYANKAANSPYLGLALTKKTTLTVRLPPRPFVKRSLTAALPNIMRHWKGMLRP